MKFFSFFLNLWVIFVLPDPDPDPATQINDPQPCTKVFHSTQTITWVLLSLPYLTGSWQYFWGRAVYARCKEHPYGQKQSSTRQKNFSRERRCKEHPYGQKQSSSRQKNFSRECISITEVISALETLFSKLKRNCFKVFLRVMRFLVYFFTSRPPFL